MGYTPTSTTHTLVFLGVAWSIKKKFVNRFKGPKHHINIAICGKYNSLHDAYKSILEAFNHASIDNNAKIHLKWVDS